MTWSIEAEGTARARPSLFISPRRLADATGRSVAVQALLLGHQGRKRQPHGPFLPYSGRPRTYLRAAGYTAANPHLIAQQAGIGFARALGGGMVAAIDGMRFVVPVPSLMARPNRKFFGPKRGMTWLNE